MSARVALSHFVRSARTTALQSSRTFLSRPLHIAASSARAHGSPRVKVSLSASAKRKCLPVLACYIPNTRSEPKMLAFIGWATSTTPNSSAVNPAEVEAMQCLEEGTQKLEEGDVQAAKVCTHRKLPRQLTYVLAGTIQTQCEHQADRKLAVQPGRYPLPLE